MPELTRETILDHALAIADQEGIRALSMRRLGRELGVEAMSLYHHIDSKDALLDGMLERVLTQIQVPPASDDPAEDCRRFARALRTAWLEHPGLTGLLGSRPAITPAALDVLEAGLVRAHRLGIPPGQALDAVQGLYVWVLGHVQFVTAPVPEQAQTLDYAMLDPGRYPALSSCPGLDTTPDPAAHDVAFERALDAWIRGWTRRPGGESRNNSV